MQDRGRQMPLKQMPWRQVMQQESIKLLVLTTDLPWDRLPSHSLRFNQRSLRTAGHLQYYPRWLHDCPTVSDDQGTSPADESPHLAIAGMFTVQLGLHILLPKELVRLGQRWTVID